MEDLLPPENGGVNHDLKYSKNCKVCRNVEISNVVNYALATGATYKDTWTQVDPLARAMGIKLTVDNIRSHQKTHMPYEARAIREIQERRAEQYKKDFIEGTQSIIAPATYAETMMIKAYQAMATSKTYPAPKEGLEAAKMLYQINRDEEGALDASQAMIQLDKIIRAVQAVVPESYWTSILEYLEHDGSQPPAALARAYEVDDDDEVYDPIVEDDERDDLV